MRHWGRHNFGFSGVRLMQPLGLPALDHAGAEVAQSGAHGADGRGGLKVIQGMGAAA